MQTDVSHLTISLNKPHLKYTQKGEASEVQNILLPIPMAGPPNRAATISHLAFNKNS
jgi:hypothetical protein